MDHEPLHDAGIRPPERLPGFDRTRFRDQDHADAFDRYYRHVLYGTQDGTDGCGCGRPGGDLCAEAQRLVKAFHAMTDAP